VPQEVRKQTTKDHKAISEAAEVAVAAANERSMAEITAMRLLMR